MARVSSPSFQCQVLPSFCRCNPFFFFSFSSPSLFLFLLPFHLLLQSPFSIFFLIRSQSPPSSSVSLGGVVVSAFSLDERQIEETQENFSFPSFRRSSFQDDKAENFVSRDLHFRPRRSLRPSSFSFSPNEANLQEGDLFGSGVPTPHDFPTSRLLDFLEQQLFPEASADQEELFLSPFVSRLSEKLLSLQDEDYSSSSPSIVVTGPSPEIISSKSHRERDIARPAVYTPQGAGEQHADNVGLSQQDQEVNPPHPKGQRIDGLLHHYEGPRHPHQGRERRENSLNSLLSRPLFFKTMDRESPSRKRRRSLHTRHQNTSVLNTSSSFPSSFSPPSSSPFSSSFSGPFLSASLPSKSPASTSSWRQEIYPLPLDHLSILSPDMFFSSSSPLASVFSSSPLSHKTSSPLLSSSSTSPSSTLGLQHFSHHPRVLSSADRDTPREEEEERNSHLSSPALSSPSSSSPDGEPPSSSKGTRFFPLGFVPYFRRYATTTTTTATSSSLLSSPDGGSHFVILDTELRGLLLTFLYDLLLFFLALLCWTRLRVYRGDHICSSSSTLQLHQPTSQIASSSSSPLERGHEDKKLMDLADEKRRKEEEENTKRGEEKSHEELLNGDKAIVIGRKSIDDGDVDAGTEEGGEEDEERKRERGREDEQREEEHARERGGGGEEEDDEKRKRRCLICTEKGCVSCVLCPCRCVLGTYRLVVCTWKTLHSVGVYMKQPYSLLHLKSCTDRERRKKSRLDRGFTEKEEEAMEEEEQATTEALDSQTPCNLSSSSSLLPISQAHVSSHSGGEEGIERERKKKKGEEEEEDGSGGAAKEDEEERRRTRRGRDDQDEEEEEEEEEERRSGCPSTSDEDNSVFDYTCLRGDLAAYLYFLSIAGACCKALGLAGR
ncbi:tranport-associated late exocytosis, partial [Cystoisospora suis]